MWLHLLGYPQLKYLLGAILLWAVEVRITLAAYLFIHPLTKMIQYREHGASLP